MSLLVNPAHPGEVLYELYLKPLGMSAIALAKRLDVPRTRIERLIKQETALSADSAIRLATFFNTTPEYWMNLQRGWDLARAQSAVDVSKIRPLEAA
jgi:addiction module HigA family antidote